MNKLELQTQVPLFPLLYISLLHNNLSITYTMNKNIEQLYTSNIDFTKNTTL